MNATITFANPDQAAFIAGMPQLAGNGHVAEQHGPILTLDAAALRVLAGLPEDNDGHYDGTYVWVGGSEYQVDTQA